MEEHAAYKKDSLALEKAVCSICGYAEYPVDEARTGVVRGNTTRFLETSYIVWKCPRCHALKTLGTVNYHDIYADYPLKKRKLDIFARGTFKNLLKRLRRSGLQKHHRILDYGCGNGIFVRYLRQKGYTEVTGYDPYEPEYSDTIRDGDEFDVVIANDVIEHCENPSDMLGKCGSLLKKSGILYVGTADAGDVDIKDLDRHLMKLHPPFHRTIMTEKGLHDFVRQNGYEIQASWTRSYMDTRMPFANYRFLDELNRALGHHMDRAFDPSSGKFVAKSPRLMFFAFLGYFCPSAFEPAVILTKSAKEAI